MVNRNKEDIAREIWEWSGLKFGWHPRVTRPAYQTPDKEWHFGSPPLTLDNLFKYAVPNTDGYMLFTGEGGIHAIVSKDGTNYEAVDIELKEALAQAIFKVIENE